MNLERLKEKIKEKGLKQKYIAKYLDITPNAFTRKINGKNNFTVDEVKEMALLFDLTDIEKLEIFL